MKTWCVILLAVAKMTSPPVAHERVHTTSYEKSSAIFRRVSKVRKTHKIMTRFAPWVPAIGQSHIVVGHLVAAITRGQRTREVRTRRETL